MASAVFAVSVSAQANPLDAVQAVHNGLQATSLANLLTKIGVGTDGLPKVHSVPKLKVVVDCGEKCEFGNASRMLMASSYKDLAGKHNLMIDKERELRFIVTNYHSRPTFLRGTLGMLSGADLVKGHFEGETESLSDFSISHEMGSDEILQRLGEHLLKEVVLREAKTANADLN